MRARDPEDRLTGGDLCMILAASALGFLMLLHVFMALLAGAWRLLRWVA